MKTKLLATARNNIQASILQDVLENEGIESYLKNGVISTIYAGLDAFDPEVYVNVEDYDKAYEILKEGFPELA